MDHCVGSKYNGRGQRSEASSGTPTPYLNTWLIEGTGSQARGNLELIMKRQLELRKEETKALHMYVCSLTRGRLI